MFSLKKLILLGKSNKPVLQMFCVAQSLAESIEAPRCMDQMFFAKVKHDCSWLHKKCSDHIYSQHKIKQKRLEK